MANAKTRKAVGNRKLTYDAEGRALTVQSQYNNSAQRPVEYTTDYIAKTGTASTATTNRAIRIRKTSNPV